MSQNAPDCPVCGTQSRHDALHPDATLFRCPSCDHCFADLQSLRREESYDQKYYEETHREWFTHPNLKLFDAIADALQGSGPIRSVIDVGCGRGQFLDRMASRFPDSEFVGLDLSPNEARSNIRFVQGDIYSAAVDQRFDAVVSLATIEHVADVHQFVQRLHALCNPGARVVIMTVSERGIVYRVARLLKRAGLPFAFNRLYHIHHLNHFTVSSLHRLVEQHGFTVLDTLLSNPPLAATDVGAESGVVRAVLKSGVLAAYTLGQVTGGTLLQTVVCRPPTVPAKAK